jgi:rhodanese-related sulfurtransferase
MKTASIEGILLVMLIASVPLFSVTAIGEGGTVKDLAPKEAFQYLSEHSGAVLVDVRSRAEYEFVGHPPMAYNIPLLFWNPQRYRFEPNQHFTKDLESRFGKDVPIFFMCRSGGRSAKAAEEAASVGYKQVFNVAEGFEGSKDGEGHRAVNGWKNAGLPYTYRVSDKLNYRPAR